MRATLERVDRQATKLTRLVSQLLDVSRLETGRLRLEVVPTNLADLLRDAAMDGQA